MKRHITLSIDSEVIKKARKTSHQLHTSISHLVEEFLVKISGRTSLQEKSFVEKWTGKYSLREHQTKDERSAALRKRYRL
jgi:hypothetical protein